MAKHFLLYLSLICIIPISLFGQSYNGTPYIQSYTTHKLPQLTENWSILQDEKGIMYFGGPGGVIQFNGHTWSLIPNANKSRVRSLALDEKTGRIYLGAQVDFGFLEPDESGRLVYTSLRHKIPNQYRNFDDIWETYVTRYGVIFQTNTAIYIYQDDTIKVFQDEKKYKYSFYVNERFFVEQDDIGLLELVGDSLVLVKGGGFFLHERRAIHAMLPYEGNDILIIDNVKGCFLLTADTIVPLDFPVNKFISDNIIFSAIQLKNGNYALGTQQNGMAIIDKKGNILLHLNKKTGLQNNSVRTIYQDKHLNLWLALENGLDHVNITSPFSILNELYGLEGSVVATKLIGNKLYASTNMGLYVKDWEGTASYNRFEFIESTKGEIRSVSYEKNRILVGHHNGVYKVNGKSAEHLENREYGAWIFRKIKENENLLLVGHYNGLFLMEWKNDKWNYKGPIHGFSESSKYIEVDTAGNIWISHANKGIWKIRLNHSLDSIGSLEFYTKQHGLPASTGNIVFKVHNEILFATEKGIYKFNEQTNQFYEEESLTKLTGKVPVKGLFEGANNSIWFLAEGQDNKELNLINEIGNIYRDSNGELQLFNQPFHKLKNLNIEYIESINNAVTIFSTANGVIIYNSEIVKDIDETFHALIQRVEKSNQADSIVFAGMTAKNNNSNEKLSRIPYSINGLKFFVSAGYFEDIEKITYKFKLEGLEKDWSEWTSSLQKEYTNLAPGQYTFRVIAKNIYGKESKESSFSFIILTPWYKTTIAYIIYSFLAIIVIVILIQFYT
ncbi:MAG TPA: triple tyrosine motif-containing protein, partial [Cytophagaceae bacterium]